MNNIQFPARAADADSISFTAFEVPGSRPKFENMVILGGQTLVKGSVLGIITASGKLKLSASAAGDGSQNPVAVLHHDITTLAADGVTAQDMNASVAVTGGAYNEDALVLGAGMTAAAVKLALIARGFTFRTPGFSG